MQQYLYRGTSRDWPGSEATQLLGISSLSSDPLIAVLFGLECRRHGEGVLLAVPNRDVRNLFCAANVLADIESEVAVRIPPRDLLSYAAVMIPAEVARDILRNMGFDLPEVIASYRRLRNELIDTLKRGWRLSPSQIDQFDVDLKAQR